jgi:hypothetical protein
VGAAAGVRSNYQLGYTSPTVSSGPHAATMMARDEYGQHDEGDQVASTVRIWTDSRARSLLRLRLRQTARMASDRSA